MRRLACVVSLVIILFAVSYSSAQPANDSTVPNLIRYNGTWLQTSSAAVSSQIVGVTFAGYKQQEGGAPVWMETQNVALDASGHYTVLLGSTRAEGLPADLFSTQEERWLGVQVQGQAEQPRVMLVSVPYAMKAAEADKLSGHRASEFVTADSLQRAVKEQLQQQTGAPLQAHTTAVGVSPNLTSDPYVDNGTALQTGTNFNIDGNGTAATFNATSLYKLAGTPVLGSTGSQGLFLGAGAGQNNSGSYNTFLGVSAGQSNTTANYNTFIGYAAGKSNTTGTPVTFVGMNAGYHNTTGNQNFFLGVNAGYYNTTGFNNVFIGNQAGYANTTGGRNTFIGVSAGNANTTGSNNLFMGNAAGTAAGATASNNIYIANPGAATDNGLIRIGAPTTQTSAYIAGIYGNAPSGALPVVVNANGQLGTTTAGIGVTSFNSRTGAVVPAANDYGFSLLSGTLGGLQLSGTYANPLTLNNASNSFTGSFTGNGGGLSGVPVATGSPNYIQNGTALQSSANFNISGNGSANVLNTVSGYQIGGSNILSVGTAPHNLFLGVGAGANNTSAQADAFFGYQAGFSNTTGGANAFSGYQAGFSNTTGSGNTFSGTQAGFSNTTGGNNTFYGNTAGNANTTGSNNTFSGWVAGQFNTTGNENAFYGAGAGLFNTTGTLNTFSGAQAGIANTTGSYNAFYGHGAGGNNTTGAANTFYGRLAGVNNTTGNANVYVANQGPPSGNETNAIRIGSPYATSGCGAFPAPCGQTTAFIAGIYGASVGGSGIGVYVDANGQLGTTVSSRRFKEQIRDMGDSTNGLLKLRPVTYFYKPEYDKGPRTLQYGMIAEEVAEVYPDLVAYESDGKPYTVKYQYLTTMLLNEMQKQYHRAEVQAEVIKTQQQEIDGLKAQLLLQNAAFQERLSRLESIVGRQAQIAADLPHQ